MNSFPENSDSAADEQASLWAARLDGSVLSAADRSALDVWLGESPSHRTLLSRYCQFSVDLEQSLLSLVESGAVPRPASATPARRGWNLRLLAGTALAAAAAVAITVWFARPSAQFENFATSVAQRQSFTLADGTHVELNAHTSLRVEFTRGERHVRLADGEAYFAVSKNPSRPFLVETPSGSVRVTGTMFDVRTDGAPNFEVAVTEGSVQVRPGEISGGSSSPVLLGAGEKLSAIGGTVKVQALSTATMADALAWRQGQVVFDRVPLRDALARFARYHGRNLSATTAAADLPVGGRFSLDDLDGFFTALEGIYPVKVTHAADGTVQVDLPNPR